MPLFSGPHEAQNGTEKYRFTKCLVKGNKAYLIGVAFTLADNRTELKRNTFLDKNNQTMSS